MVSSVFILLPFLTVSQHESGTRTTISWSVIIYSKTLSSQCRINTCIPYLQHACITLSQWSTRFSFGSLLWSYDSWIYNYRFNQCLSPLKLWVRTRSWRGVLDTTLCDHVCQWLATGWWFSPVSSTNKSETAMI